MYKFNITDVDGDGFSLSMKDGLATLTIDLHGTTNDMAATVEVFITQDELIELRNWLDARILEETD